MTKTISAQVSRKLLKKAHLLFNQSTPTLLAETLQNCRRAKSSLVEITVAPSGDGSRVTIADNGEGICDPAALLDLGKSGWDDTTEGLESPAGMGFFSLCHLPEGVEVRSKGWRVHIDPLTFRGEASCEVLPTAQIAGTTLSFFLPEAPNNVAGHFESSLKFYPVRATLNGKELPREDFLAKADYIHRFPGGRIGVFAENNRPWGWCWDPKPVNFHGLVLRADRNMTGTERWPYAFLVDIENNAALDLVLPSRDKIVENRKLEDLRAACREASYRYILASRRPHKLGYAHYKEARAMGLELPEAEAALHLATPTNLCESNNGWTGPTPANYEALGGKTSHPACPDSILSTLSQAELAALHICGADIPILLEADEAMAGYSWYPKRKTLGLTQKITTGRGATRRIPAEGNAHQPIGAKNEAKNQHARDITLELKIQELPCKTKTLEFPAFIAIDTELTGEEGIDGGWLPKRGKEASEKIDNSLLQTLFFNPCEDGDCDSYDTQLDRFNDYANTKLVAVFSGAQSAANYAAEQALNRWEVKCALAALKQKSITLKLDSKGWVKIASGRKEKPSKKTK